MFGYTVLCWLGLGVFSMVCWALIIDVIDYSELKNGVREDGSGIHFTRSRLMRTLHF
ncbi:MAG: MFS transporter [Lachnospiraceae bacterium]